MDIQTKKEGDIMESNIIFLILMEHYLMKRLIQSLTVLRQL